MPFKFLPCFWGARLAGGVEALAPFLYRKEKFLNMPGIGYLKRDMIVILHMSNRTNAWNRDGNYRS